jgi:Fe-S-cluster containining protein
MTNQLTNNDLLAMIDQLDISSEDRDSVRDVLIGVNMAPSESFSPEVNERLTTAGDHAKNVMSSMVSPWPTVYQLLNAASAASTASKRVFWINKAADALAHTFQPVSACKAGCSHCCHIPVNLTKAEADFLGKAIGLKPSSISTHATGRNAEFEPCTFLAGGHCSIYKDRPSVCRTHMNMDRDDLLCRLVPGAKIPVPYLDTRPVVMARVLAGGRSPSADIRQWFPQRNSTSLE